MGVKIVIRKVSPKNVARYMEKIRQVFNAANWYEGIEVHPEEDEG